MLTSRRLVLASAALVLGLSACGSTNSTTSGSTAGTTAGTVHAGGPRVIAFGSSGGGAVPAAATGEAADKMMAIRNLNYVFDGTLPTLSDSAGSWQFPAGFTPDRERVASMAAALGVQGDVRALPADQGGGWMVGPQDYSAATLTVSADGLGSWWFNPTPEPVATISACAQTPVEPVSVPEGDTLNTISPLDIESTDAITNQSGTDQSETDLPDCPEPTPPVGVPQEAEAISKAKALFADLGYDPASFDYEFFGDEWNANVTAYLLLDGQRSPVSMSVGFGGAGALSWASGNLATPVPSDAYPLAGVQTGIDRLNDQAQQWMGLGMGYASSGMRVEGSVATSASGSGVAVSDTAIAPAAGSAPSDSEVAPSPVVSAPPESVPGEAMPVDPLPVQCDPAADCVPVDTTPVTIHLTTVKLDLTMVWDANNTVWLLPAYTFGDADGGMYTVIAVTDEYLQIPTASPVPEPPTTDVVVGTDVPVPDTVTGPSGDPADATTPFVDPPAIDQDAAATALVGLSEADATAAAEAKGWTLRVAQRDGVDLAVTDDFRTDRVNVAVAAGVVVAVQSIG